MVKRETRVPQQDERVHEAIVETLRQQTKESQPLRPALVVKAETEAPRQSDDHTRPVQKVKAAPVVSANVVEKSEHVTFEPSHPAVESASKLPVYELATTPAVLVEKVSVEQPGDLMPVAREVQDGEQFQALQENEQANDVAVQFVEAAQTSAEKDDAPAIVVEIAERLTALDESEREALVPLFTDIAEAVQTVHLLLLAEAAPEKIAEAKEHVTELTMLLFEALGKECDPEEIEQYVQAMLEAAFVERLQVNMVWAQEGLGTHEVKHHFKDLLASLAGMLPRLRAHRLLGMLAVRHHPQYGVSFAADGSD